MAYLIHKRIPIAVRRCVGALLPASLYLLVVLIGCSEDANRGESVGVDAPRPDSTTENAPAAIPSDVSFCGEPMQPVRPATVEIPETYELANIILLLTDFPERFPHIVHEGSSYVRAVRRRFARFRSHQLIQDLNRVLIDESRALNIYYGFRENSIKYVFVTGADQDEQPRLHRSGIELTYWADDDEFGPRVALIEDFAETTEAGTFLANHRPFYEEQLNRYRGLVQLDTMRSWLERRFSGGSGDLRVVFSPIIGGAHSTDRYYDAEGRTVMVMFIGGPALADQVETTERRAAILDRIVFTEIDHQYVNPATDAYVRELYELTGDSNVWNTGAGAFYDSPVSTFNEYMTWGVYLIHARDRYDPRTFRFMKDRVVRLMVERRRFSHFPAFADRLLALSARSEGALCIPDLYPDILTWMAEEQASIAPPADQVRSSG